jgi:hypothetical protein
VIGELPGEGTNVIVQHERAVHATVATIRESICTCASSDSESECAHQESAILRFALTKVARAPCAPPGMLTGPTSLPHVIEGVSVRYKETPRGPADPRQAPGPDPCPALVTQGATNLLQVSQPSAGHQRHRRCWGDRQEIPRETIPTHTPTNLHADTPPPPPTHTQ